MTPSGGPKKGLLIIPDKGDNGPPPLSSPDEPDQDDQQPSQGTCASCIFYEGAEQSCKRYPDWVPHAPDDWCGEYKAGKPHDSMGAGALPQAQQNISSAPSQPQGPYTKQPI